MLTSMFQLPISVQQTTPKLTGFQQQPFLLSLTVLYVGRVRLSSSSAPRDIGQKFIWAGPPWMAHWPAFPLVGKAGGLSLSPLLLHVSLQQCGQASCMVASGSQTCKDRSSQSFLRLRPRASTSCLIWLVP